MERKVQLFYLAIVGKNISQMNFDNVSRKVGYNHDACALGRVAGRLVTSTGRRRAP